eukprot:TRINITY_DN53969_c0_g1_i1.p2 TRINITY_DN53969_c0_g1~~TRINITY_DN53969_c0_g1_i1.p2  ORF type:complete len:155 (+),score=48.50 TRINITY_DN53969_c0_g1_i1:54-467(+)
MARPITDVMRDYNRGAFVKEVTELVGDATRKVVDTGKKGKIVITIEIRPSTGSSPAVLLKMDVVDKSPQPETPAEYMYVTPGDDLVRNHPDQGELKLIDVTAGLKRGEVVDPQTGEIITPNADQLRPPTQQQQQRSA